MDDADVADAAHEVLVFRLGAEEYALDILKVQEIRGYEPATRLANAPEYIKGVINLRGEIVPIIDMRLRFCRGEPAYDQFTVVIILNVARRVVGMVVDGVADVVTLLPEHVRPAPDMGSAIDMSSLTGIGSLGERMLILVDIERLMASVDIGILAPQREAA